MAGGGKLQSFENHKQREGSGDKSRKGERCGVEFWKGGDRVSGVVPVEVSGLHEHAFCVKSNIRVILRFSFTSLRL